MIKAEQEKTGLTGLDKRQDDLRSASDDDHRPEGLERERKGPFDKNVGRNEAASQVPRAQPHSDPVKKKTGEF
jgi:hypothetical protein